MLRRMRVLCWHSFTVLGGTAPSPVQSWCRKAQSHLVCIPGLSSKGSQTYSKQPGFLLRSSWGLGPLTALALLPGAPEDSPSSAEFLLGLMEKPFLTGSPGLVVFAPGMGFQEDHPYPKQIPECPMLWFLDNAFHAMPSLCG